MIITIICRDCKKDYSYELIGTRKKKLCPQCRIRKKKQMDSVYRNNFLKKIKNIVREKWSGRPNDRLIEEEFISIQNGVWDDISVLI